MRLLRSHSVRFFSTTELPRFWRSIVATSRRGSASLEPLSPSCDGSPEESLRDLAGRWSCLEPGVVTGGDDRRAAHHGMTSPAARDIIHAFDLELAVPQCFDRTHMSCLCCGSAPELGALCRPCALE